MELRKEDIGARIKEIRESLGMTQVEFGRALDSGPKSISAYETGNADTSPLFLAKVALLGGKTLDWVIAGKEGPKTNAIDKHPEDSTVTMPVRAMAGAGHPCCIDQLEPVGTITLDKTYDGVNIQVLLIRGNSMEPTIMDGSHVGIDVTVKTIVSGQMYAVFFPHEGIVVKRLWIGPEVIKISSDNPTAPDHEIPVERINWDTFVQGRVKWTVQKY